MRRYFLMAKDVGALTRVFAAKLEADRVKTAPKGISRFLPGRAVKRKPLDEPGFHEEGGRLCVDATAFERDPVNLLRLFRLADRRNLDLHPDAFTAAARAVGLITSAVRRDRNAARVFLDILARGRDPQRTLALMNDAGVLGRYLPEFGRIVAQMQFNMYHSYTVDEHTLRAVGVIADIAAGRLVEDHPLSAQVMPLIADREALFLAMLLHDTGKGGAGGQEVAGARSARQACERLGLERSKIELVAWLVEHHLVMSDYAQKRDVSDPRTVADFARIVQTPERLRLLLVLTVADIRAVGPGVWNGWKGQLMRELYTATEAVFRGGRGSDAAAALRRYQENAAYDARVRLAKADAAAEPWGDAMEDAYFSAFADGEVLAHARLAAEAHGKGGAAAEAHVRLDLNAAELVVTAGDRPRLFVDLAGAVTAAGANVVGARVFTSRGGQALDVFYLQDVSGAPFGESDPHLLPRLADTVAAAARGEPHGREPRRIGDLGRAAAFAITPTVILDNEASETATVVEASGRDRPGLLAALARTLSDAGLQIVSAHIDGYGERAVDAFYVTDGQGAKVIDTRRANALKGALMADLADDEVMRALPRRSGLSRARASVAR
jgi:[protein-PII] uridylyltransferase